MFRLLIEHLVGGIITGWAVLGVLIALDTANLRSLTFESPDGPMALGLLAFFFALTFGSVGMAMGVMVQGRNTDGPRSRPTGGPRSRKKPYDEDDRPLPRMAVPAPSKASPAKPAAT